jgi:hypothetical protein
LNTLNRVHDALARALAPTAPDAAGFERAVNITPSPISLAVPQNPTSVLNLPRTHRISASPILELGTYEEGKILAHEDSSDSADDESFFIQDALPPQCFGEDDLRAHLQSYPWTPQGRLILGDLIGDDTDLMRIQLFDMASHGHTNLYDVGPDGAVVSVKAEEGRDGGVATWDGLSAINLDRTRRQAVGRIAMLRDPPAALIGAVHLTMNQCFDMDSIFCMLTEEAPTKAYMKGCMHQDPRHQRSYIFCFKYHTIIEDVCKPLPWQKADVDLDFTDDHVPISTCASIVALSLSGRPCATLRRRTRIAKTIAGQIYDPFAPWRVLSMQCYPDWKATVDVHEMNRHYVNGPEVFLVTLLSEFRDAGKRFMELNERIVKIVLPPGDFLYNREVRDKLLFDDNHLSYSRRYFWATHSLVLLNGDIDAMIAAYKEAFTDEVWSGEHKYIWPGSKYRSSRYSNWRKKMDSLRKQFEMEIEQLEHVRELNERTQNKIKPLRDQLFSGTSVRESREAVNQARITVMQGDNIRLLTLVSIFFLPLTFVTSIFGMTNMPTNGSFRTFGIVIAAICVPTYFLIISVIFTVRNSPILIRLGWFFNLIVSGLRPNSGRMKRYNEKYGTSKDRTGGEREVKSPTSSTTSRQEEKRHENNVETSKASERQPKEVGAEPEARNFQGDRAGPVQAKGFLRTISDRMGQGQDQSLKSSEMPV